jgi:hypothetical protein
MSINLTKKKWLTKDLSKHQTEFKTPLEWLNVPVLVKDVPVDVPMDKMFYNVLVLLKPPVLLVSLLKP